MTGERKLELRFSETGVAVKNGTVTRGDLERAIATMISMYKAAEKNAGIPEDETARRLSHAIDAGFYHKGPESGTIVTGPLEEEAGV